MPATAQFCFHHSLNDFLKPAFKGRWISYAFKHAPAVKDAIEALGVPHVEVYAIYCNSSPVGFNYSLQEGDRCEIYPFDIEGCKDLTPVEKLTRQKTNQFILDVHLGALARALRMLGIDAVYQTDYEDRAIAQRAVNESRAVLTRDVGLLKHKILHSGYWLRSQHLPEQVREVFHYFDLKEMLKPFSRCIACNGLLAEVPKQTVLKEVPPKTVLYYHEFYRCTHCQKVYWKGSHYENMLQTVKRLQLL